jgi:EmrB/QacA subfamily drug resistance transporter
VLPLSGWLGDRFGHRNILLGAIVVFTIGSGLCGLAGNLAELVLARVVQGIGSGLMTPVGMALLYRTFPPAERVRVTSILMIPTIIAPITGPVLGGALVDDLSWRWVFWVNLPLGVFALLFGLSFLRPEPGESVGPFDIRGFLIGGIGLAALMYGLSDGPTAGWSSARIIVAIIVGLILLIVLVYQQLHAEHPLLTLHVFRDRLFRSGTGVTIVSSMAFFGFLFVLALFLQNGLGFSPLKSGLSTIPEAVGVLIGAQLVSRFLYPRFGPKPLMIIGSFAMAVLLLMLTTIDSGAQAWSLRAYVFGVGFTIAFVMITSQVATMARVERTEISGASTLFSAARQIASALGIAVLASALAFVGEPTPIAGHTVKDLSSYHVAFVVAAGLAVLCALVAMTLHNSDADGTRTHLAAAKDLDLSGEITDPGESTGPAGPGLDLEPTQH